MIDVPDSFKRFAKGFLFELSEDYDSVEKFVAIESRYLSSGIDSEAIILCDFLNHLIDGPYRDDELEALWEVINQEIPFNGAELRRYLPIMRDNIGLPPPPLKPRG